MAYYFWASISGLKFYLNLFSFVLFLFFQEEQRVMEVTLTMRVKNYRALSSPNSGQSLYPFIFCFFFILMLFLSLLFSLLPCIGIDISKRLFLLFYIYIHI
jgi:hypothetical protein